MKLKVQKIHKKFKHDKEEDSQSDYTYDYSDSVTEEERVSVVHVQYTKNDDASYSDSKTHQPPYRHEARRSGSYYSYDDYDYSEDMSEKRERRTTPLPQPSGDATMGYSYYSDSVDVSAVDSDEQSQILAWNNTHQAWDLNNTLFELFAFQAKQKPHASAVITTNKVFTYTTVYTHANRIAHALNSRGAKPNQLIGILMHKGWEQIVACLGVLGSGAAFLPMDASWPEERLRQVMAQGEIKLVLTQQRVLTSLKDSTLLSEITCFAVDNIALWEPFPTTALPRQQQPEDIAYVIFTSGSTGQPKGVVISHQGAINTLFDINQRFQVNEHDRVLALSNLSFDLAIYDVFGLLAVGGALVLPDANQLKEPAHWLSLLTTHHVTLWNSVPMFMQMLVEFLEHLPVTDRPPLTETLRLVLLSGDWIPLALPNRAKQYFSSSELISLGGATEGSIWSILYPIKAIDPHWKSIPYGRPMGNQHMYVLKEDLTPCPIGTIGEIYIGGQGVARGYWRDDARTAASFITHAKTGERLYKTGDLGQWSAAGHIEFIGRKDTQVKIHGHRIELGEIESTLTRHPSVDQCVVTAYQQGNSHQLLAYVVPNRQQAITTEKQEAHDHDWRDVYEGIYHNRENIVDRMFNISGWRSSYTGELISNAEMHEWVNHTVNRILAMKPKRVLEIGCGTGLIAARIAPHCETYVATDISARAVALIEALKKTQPDLNHMVTFQRPANDFSNWDTLTVDTIVINSVVQYFSSVEYLLDVIERAIQLLQPSGQLFIGDVRHLGLLEAYHTSVQLHKTARPLSKSAFLKQIRSHVLSEKELLIDPTFFHALRYRIPRLQHAQVQLKSGKSHNELNRFRYDVILYVSSEPVPMLTPKWRDWQLGDDVSTLRKQLRAWKNTLDRKRSNIIGIKAIPNSRLSREATALTWIHSEGKIEFDSSDALKILPTTGIDPHAMIPLGATLGLRVELRWHYENPTMLFDALFIFQPPSVSTYPAIACNEGCCNIVVWKKYVNDPLLTTFQHKLAPELRSYLALKLPHYMLPANYLMLSELPLSSNGKINRQALPSPAREIAHSTQMSATRSETEERLAILFCEALELHNINITDNFFSCGGNSLLAVHLIMCINQQFKTNYPVSTLFTHQTVASFAQFLQTHERAAIYRPILTFNADGSRPPIFFIHSGRGGAEAYTALASYFDRDQPIHCVESYNLCNEPPFLRSIEEMAAQYLRFMQSIQPEGPYYLGGWSLGGSIALEMAHILTSMGEIVAVIYLIDAYVFSNFESKKFLAGIETLVNNDPYYDQLPSEIIEHVRSVDRVQMSAEFTYKPHPYMGDVILLKANDKWRLIEMPELGRGWIARKFFHHAFSKKHNGWSKKLLPNLVIYSVPGDHQSMMESENVHAMAQIIQTDLLHRYHPTRLTDLIESNGSLLFFRRESNAKNTMKTKKKSCCCALQ